MDTNAKKFSKKAAVINIVAAIIFIAGTIFAIIDLKAVKCDEKKIGN